MLIDLFLGKALQASSGSIYLGVGRLLKKQSNYSVLRHTGVNVGYFSVESSFFYEVSGYIVPDYLKRSQFVNIYSDSYLLNFIIGPTSYSTLFRVRLGFVSGLILERIRVKILDYRETHNEFSFQVGGILSLDYSISKRWEAGLRAGNYYCYKWQVFNWYYASTLAYKF